MKIIDLHCDVLYKMQVAEDKNEFLDFRDSPMLDVNLERMQQGSVKIQAFAIFVDPEHTIAIQYEKALQQIAIFHRDVLGKNNELVQIKSWRDINTLKKEQIGAFLTLEGLDCIGNDLQKLVHMLDEGILSVGLTWNYGNFVADGVGEIRGAGLSNFGFDVVALLNKRGILVDVSHLSVKGFDDVMEVATYPIASHSNVYQIADHRRNLNNRQIMQMIARKAPIHLVFAPGFVNTKTRDGKVVIEDVLKHIDYLIQMGARDLIGLGSDFDGISNHVKNLTNASEYPNLLQQITSNYDKILSDDISYLNFLRYVEKIASESLILA